MTNAIKLVMYSFDDLENRDAREEHLIGVFVDGDKLTAHGKIEEWFKKKSPFHMYLGWDGKVYPRFKLEKITLK